MCDAEDIECQLVYPIKEFYHETCAIICKPKLINTSVTSLQDLI